VAGAVAVGPVLAVAGDRAVDDPGVGGAHRLVAHAEAIEDAGPEGLQDDVGAGDGPQERLSPLRVLEVQADRALAAGQREEQRRLGGLVDAVVVGRRGADVVAGAGVLDLDDVGAEVAEQQRAEASGEQPAEVEDADALKRRGHAAARRGTPSISRAWATVAER